MTFARYQGVLPLVAGSGKMPATSQTVLWTPVGGLRAATATPEVVSRARSWRSVTLRAFPSRSTAIGGKASSMRGTASRTRSVPMGGHL